MTIASIVNENTYVGAGSTDTFSYGFKIFLNSDLLVTQRDDNDVESTLVLVTDYTVTGAGDTAGGTIVLTAGNLTTDYVLTIRRVRPLTQSTDIRNLGDAYPETMENALDHLIMIAQQNARDHDRTMILPETTSGVSLVLPEPVALKLIRFDSLGTGLELIDIGDFSSLMTTVDASLTISSGNLSVTDPVRFCTMGGAVDALTASTTPAPASLTNNLRVYADSLGANATATPTFNLNSLGAKTIVKEGDVALVAGDIHPANGRLDLVFDSSLDKWILMNPIGATKAVIQSSGYIHATTTGSADAYELALTPTVTAYTEGMIFIAKIHAAALTTSPTLDLDGLGAKGIKRENGDAILVGDLPIGYKAIFQMGTVNLLLLNPPLVKNHDHTSVAEGGHLAGQEVQAVITSSGAFSELGSTAWVADDTTPQKTEGNEALTLAITPVYDDSILEIEASINCTCESAVAHWLTALFVDTDAPALACAMGEGQDSSANRYNNLKLYFQVVSGSTSARTYKIHVGAIGAGVINMNGNSSGARYNGTLFSYLKIREIKV